MAPIVTLDWPRFPYYRCCPSLLRFWSRWLLLLMQKDSHMILVLYGGHVELKMHPRLKLHPYAPVNVCLVV